MPLWNEINLPSPNSDFRVVDVQDLNVAEDISKLAYILSTAATKISDNHPAWDETTIFLALQERLSLKLPCNKFLQIQKTVGRCLRNLVILKLFDQYISLAEKFLDGIRDASYHARLPSRQQLEYVLIRTQGATKLILKTISYIEETFLHLLQQMRIGHLVQPLVMSCATLGRIRTTYMDLLRQLCDTYEQLLPWKEFLAPGVWVWPEDPALPENLWQWLNPDVFEEKTNEDFGQSENLLPFLQYFFTSPSIQEILNTERNNDECAQVDDNGEEEQEVTIIEHQKDLECVLLDEDIGEVQPREAEEPIPAVTEIVSSEDEENSENEANDIQEEKKENEETMSLLDAAKETTTVKEMILLLKLLSLKKQTALAKLFNVQISSDIQEELKTLFSKVKRNFSNSKVLDPPFRKAHRNLLLQETKKELLSILNGANDEETVPMESNSSHTIQVPKCSVLTPVHTLPKLRKLVAEIKKLLNQKPNQCSILAGMFKRCCKNVELLRENGEKILCKKLIYSTSKKMIGFYGRKCH